MIISRARAITTASAMMTEVKFFIVALMKMLCGGCIDEEDSKTSISRSCTSMIWLGGGINIGLVYFLKNFAKFFTFPVTSNL